MIVVPVVEDAFANLFGEYKSSRTSQVSLVGAGTIYLQLEPEFGTELQRHVYNMPYLFDREGLPWSEANSFLLNMIESEHARKRPTDLARRKASQLLHFKLYCEKNDIDWLDFTGRRRSHRPTYRYFRNLVDSGDYSAANVNQRTATIFQFYSYLAANLHDIDLERVDTYKDIEIVIAGAPGQRTVVKARKRSQTIQTPRTAPVGIGYIKEYGEELRPLTSEELREFLGIINGPSWTPLERLIIQTAITTGARKQTVLTLRYSHLRKMVDQAGPINGFYRLHVGPGTGVDTKFNKKQVLHFPAPLIDQLSIFTESEFYKSRKSKHLQTLHESPVHLPPGLKSDPYIFLSEQGNCFYMAKNDHRYPYVKSPQTGQMTDYLKRKLLKSASVNFPKDFTFHWLRATFGYLLYQWLLPHLKSGTLKAGEEIQIIQQRMHHENRETTENYLKLYRCMDERLHSQEIFESEIFNWESVSDDIGMKDNEI